MCVKIIFRLLKHDLTSLSFFSWPVKAPVLIQGIAQLALPPLLLLSRDLGCFLQAHVAVRAQALHSITAWDALTTSCHVRETFRQVSCNIMCASFLPKWSRFCVKENASLLCGEVPKLVTCSKFAQLLLSNAPDVKVTWTSPATQDELDNWGFMTMVSDKLVSCDTVLMVIGIIGLHKWHPF